MPTIHTFYDGSTALAPIAERVGVEVDKLNLVLCQLASIPLAIAYYRWFAPRVTSKNARLTYQLLIGLLFCYFCFGKAIKHILWNAVISYTLLAAVPPEYVHRVTFLFSMGHLVYMHWYRWSFLSDYHLDVTGPFMIVVQKTTSVAFSLHDGRTKGRHWLNESQKSEALSKRPPMLAYLSYIFHFQTILTGPLTFFGDYMKFISGENFGTHRDTAKPWKPAVSKLVFACSCMFLVLLSGSSLTPSTVEIPDLRSTNWMIWWFRLCLVLIVVRMQYYYAWIFADAVCNLSGLGFNGVDEKGTAKWDLVTNVHPLQYETALSFKDALDSWNITTGLWLRRVAYDRAPKRYRTVATYVLSAVWHGFSVGYYMTFLTGALFTVAARTVRRCIRPHFQHTTPLRLFYHVCTFFATQIFMSYATFPFVTMHPNPGFTVYRQMYFLPHVMAALAIVLLPKLTPARRQVDSQKAGSDRRADHAKHG